MSRRAWRGILGWFAWPHLFATLGLTLASFPASASDRVDFNIAPQSADQALVELARQASISVLFPTERISHIAAHAVRGRYRVEDALAILLQDTGLEAELTAAGSITVRTTAGAGKSTMSSIDKRSWLSVLLSSVLGAFGVHTASGQEPQSDELTRPASLDEIVVTARRREENVQTVPISITVLSQEALQQNNVQTLEQLQYVVPALSATTNAPNQGRFSLRGQGVSGNAGQPGVIVYLNEVPTPDLGAGVTSTGPGLFFDLENVQVLKGPQGTLFGKNSVGGDILLQTARPTSELGGHLQLSYGNYNDREIDAAVNIPIVSDVLLTRIAFNGQLRDGYTHLLGEPRYPGGIDADNRDSWSVRGTVTFRPADWLQNDAIFTASKFIDRSTYGVLDYVNPNPATGCGGARCNAPALFPAIYGLLAQQQALGIRTLIPTGVDGVADGYLHALNDIARITFADNITVRNIFGYFEENQALAGDQDSTVLPIFDLYTTPYSHTVHQYTEELQLLGKSPGERFDWIVGGFYQDQPQQSPLERVTYTVFGAPLYSLSKDSQRSRALYAQGTYDISAVLPHVKITGGIRYTQDNFLGVSQNGFGSLCNDIQACIIASAASLTNNAAKSHALTWTAGVDYQIVNETLLYLTSRRGYRAGGSNPPQYGDADLPEFGPEYVTDVELGVKSDWRVADIPIRTNADLWYQDYNDIQVQELISAPPGLPVNEIALTQNAARARLWGAELEATAQLTSDLQLGVTYDHVNLQYREFSPGVPAATIASLEATRTLNNPPNKYGVNARYHLPLPESIGDVSVRAVWNWQATGGDVSVPNGLGNVPSFGLLNMSADWNKVLGTPFDVSLFASNLLDRDYIVSPVPSFKIGFGYGNEIYGEPRMYGVRVRYRFGHEAK